MPTPRLAFQVSAAHLNEAEAEFPPEPRSDVDRFTASATYHQMTGSRIWATTLAYGMNAGPEVIPGDVVHLTTHAGLLETALSLSDRHTWFGRAEISGKPGHDLHMHATPATIYTVGKVQAGYVWSFPAGSGFVSGRRRDGVRQHGSAGARTAVPGTREPGLRNLCVGPAGAARESVVMLPRRVRLKAPFSTPTSASCRRR